MLIRNTKRNNLTEFFDQEGKRLSFKAAGYGEMDYFATLQ